MQFKDLKQGLWEENSVSKTLVQEESSRAWLQPYKLRKSQERWLTTKSQHTRAKTARQPSVTGKPCPSRRPCSKKQACLLRVLIYALNPALGKQRQEDFYEFGLLSEFQASLGYTVRLSQKKVKGNAISSSICNCTYVHIQMHTYTYKRKRIKINPFKKRNGWLKCEPMCGGNSNNHDVNSSCPIVDSGFCSNKTLQVEYVLDTSKMPNVCFSTALPKYRAAAVCTLWMLWSILERTGLHT